MLDQGRSAMPDQAKDQDVSKEVSQKKRGGIPLRIIPNEAEELAKEMQDIFDEDKVVHRQGSSQPERD